MLELTVATTNPNKLMEIAAELSDGTDGPVHAVVLPDGVEEAPEEGASFKDNVIGKAVWYSERIPGLVLVEDSGLEIPRLNGWPGVNSKRIGNTDNERNQMVLDSLGSAIGTQARAAYFVCSVALARDGEPLYTCTEVLEGCIPHSPRGKGGFGFDPIFTVRRSTLGLGEGWVSLSELGPRKQLVSPRVKAIGHVRKWLRLLP